MIFCCMGWTLAAQADHRAMSNVDDIRVKGLVLRNFNPAHLNDTSVLKSYAMGMSEVWLRDGTVGVTIVDKRNSYYDLLRMDEYRTSTERRFDKRK